MIDLDFLVQDTNPPYSFPVDYLASVDPDLAHDIEDVQAGVLHWGTTVPYVYLCRPMTQGARIFPNRTDLRGVRCFDPNTNGEANVMKQALIRKGYAPEIFGRVLRYLDTFLARKAAAVFVDYTHASVGVTFELIAAYSSKVPIYGLSTFNFVPSAFYDSMITYVHTWEEPIKELHLKS
jgi:hypothetical protein